jgi:hypothetical protein
VDIYNKLNLGKIIRKRGLSMGYPRYYPIIELAFFKSRSFHHFTKPDHVFVINPFDNGPPYISLYMDGDATNNCSDTNIVRWQIFENLKIDWNTFDERCAVPSEFGEKLLYICILMIALFIYKEEDIVMIASGFYKSILEKNQHFNPYESLSERQLSYLFHMAVNKYSQEYFVMSYCRDIDMIQDIQKDTAGMALLQFRYRDCHNF